VNAVLSVQDIIYIKNLVNPPYAADMKSFLTLITIDSFQGSDTANPAGFREKENVLYLNFAAFQAGSITNVNIFGSRYEANQPNVEYNWIFVLNDDIPAGGFILLKFPPNYFSLESTPSPIGLITSNNLQTIDSTKDFFKFNTNVATLYNFNGYTAGTLITVKFTGVKNPITEGLTIEFGIESQTEEFYSIDLKSDIPGVQIIAANSAGQITYNYFYTSPNNGYLLGNYYVNFILQNSIPKYGKIEVTFPLNFNSLTSFTKDSSDNIECYISGPISLIDSCKVTDVTVSLIIFEELTISAGTPPVTIYFPNVYNYNTELDSGPITIRTIYDNVVLDDSGDSETNRKATTGIDASLMVSNVNYLGFGYEPQTESATAFYNVTIKPINSFNSTAILQFVFPKIFPRGLGGDVSCSSSELQISALEPIKCSIADYVINISNIQSYNTSINTTGFTISLSGITNPALPSIAISSKIAFYIYKNPNVVSEYTYGLGTLSYGNAPPVLYMSNFRYTSNDTRVACDYGFSLTPSSTTAFSYISIDFPIMFTIEQFWNTKTYSSSLEGTTNSTSSAIKNKIMTSFGGTATNGQTFMLNIYQLFNPMVQELVPYPVVYIYNKVSKDIKMKTYNNLNQFGTPNLFNNGLIISLADDVDSLEIEAGFS